MNEINKRVKNLREHLDLSQESFGEKIGLSKSGISNIESGSRNVTEKHIKLISIQFLVNENWLRHGEGEMIIEPDTFSLDEYANKKNLSALEFDIIKCYMDLDGELRQTLMSHLKTVFNKHADSDDKNTSIKQEEDKSHLTVIAAHNDAELTKEEVSLMREDLETLKNLRK